MKKYVFMACAISTIGGAQVYYYNKARYCEQKGWDVYIFSAVPGKIYIERLKKYEKLINSKFTEYPYLYSNSRCKKIVKWMLKSIDYHQGDEIIIESSDIVQSTWGEMLAKACNGQNILNILSEKIYTQNRSVYKFLEFKYRRKEMRCIKEVIMQTFFSQKNLSEEQCYAFRAPCTNSMEDVSIPFELDLVPDKPVIGIVGRINKKYVSAALCEIVRFAENHRDKFYNILVVGGGGKTHYNQLNKLVKNKKNVKLIITGLLYPIPQKLIEKITVAIGSSGSIRLPWSLDIPSISVELYTKKALGFLGYDTENTQFALAGEELKHISDCLEEFFYNSYIEKHKDKYTSTELVSQEEINAVLDTHFEYVQLADSKKEYFDEFVNDGVKEKIMKIACQFGGHKIIHYFKKIKKLLGRS